jgi:hypothetical protein
MIRRSLLLFVAPLLLAACGGNAAPPVTARPTATQAKRSTADQRESVGITVYNSDFGLVREIRTVDLGQGVISLEFRDVSSQIEPETVHVRSTTAGGLSIFEQNYRYDLLTPQKLLEKYEGKRVKLFRWNQATGREDVFDAEVLSVGSGGPVFRIGNDITYGFPGRIGFPEVPANLIAKPSLVWLLDSKQPRQKLEVTYLTRGINWRADYVFVLNDGDATGDLQGWVTLTNQTGTSYENAQLKLVAGDVQRVTMNRNAMDAPAGAAGYAHAEEKREFREEGLFEYHLYTLSQPTSVLDNEQKQVSLLEGHDIKVDKRLIFFGNDYYYRGQYGQVSTNQKVGVYLDVQNKEANHLGMPLPKGIVRVYKADKSGAKQFIGEDNIDHTPRDEKIRIKMGEAFDVVGDRKQTSFQVFGSCSSDSEWEITLRNHKDGVEEVEMVEPMGGDWEVLSSSGGTPVKKDAHTLTFTVKVPARGETKVTYKVRVKWC